MSVIAWKLLIFNIATCTFFHETLGYRQLISNTTDAKQSSTYEGFVASRAIDGKSGRSFSSGSCSHTGKGQSEAWVEINLKKIYSINTVKIWYRNDRGSDLKNTERFHNYSLWYMENGWKECYRDETPFNVPIPMPSTVSCRHLTQYIRIYSDTPSPNDYRNVFLEICEVQISGCDVNQYGENCTNCSHGCDKCDIINGCQKCKPRFNGGNCESCKAKWYDEDCFRKCSDTCPNKENCNDVLNGSCPGRCMPGYRGDICAQKCSNGTYGFQCKDTCDTCVNASCNHITGSCYLGCIDGWTGDMCRNECSNGTYGYQCNKTCDTCANMSCNQITGTCDLGCIDGWTGYMCLKVCSEGQFGQNCSGQCQNCENETCHHVTGSCRGFCKRGWKGDLCREAIENYTEIYTYIYFVTGACGGVVMIYMFIIVVVVFRKRQRERPSNSNPGLLIETEDKGPVSALPNHNNFDSSDDARNPTWKRQQDDVMEEELYCNLELPAFESCGLRRAHSEDALVSEKINKSYQFQNQSTSTPSKTKVISNDTFEYEDTKFYNEAGTATTKKPPRVKNFQSRKKTNCPDEKEETCPKKSNNNQKIRRDRKMTVANVYSTGPRAYPRQTEGSSQIAHPPQTGGTSSTAYKQQTRGTSQRAYPQQTGDTSLTACKQQTKGASQTAYPLQTGGMSSRVYPQQTEGTVAFSQQTEGTEEAIYLNTELTYCDTANSLICNTEESMYWNTGVASDRSSDSSGYIQMT